jgi:hypothetical protein
LFTTIHPKMSLHRLKFSLFRRLTIFFFMFSLSFPKFTRFFVDHNPHTRGGSFLDHNRNEANLFPFGKLFDRQEIQWIPTIRPHSTTVFTVIPYGPLIRPNLTMLEITT